MEIRLTHQGLLPLHTTLVTAQKQLKFQWKGNCKYETFLNKFILYKIYIVYLKTSGTTFLVP